MMLRKVSRKSRKVKTSKNKYILKVIVGLGNPGRKYQYNRHNIGQRVVKQLASNSGSKFKRSLFFSSQIAEGKIEGYSVVLALPVTFMNLSGKTVARIVKRKRINLSDILIVCDDIDLDFGKIRIRDKGSDGGHRGLRSIIALLGSRDFSRCKIGIGRPASRESVKDYVLSDFAKTQDREIADIVNNAVETCVKWLREK